MRKIPMIAIFIFLLPLISPVVAANDTPTATEVQYNATYTERTVPSAADFIDIIWDSGVDREVCGYDATESVRGDCDTSTAPKVQWFRYQVNLDSNGSIIGMGNVVSFDVENKGTPHYVDMKLELCWKSMINTSKLLCVDKGEIYQGESEIIKTSSMRSDTYFVRVQAYDEDLHGRAPGGDLSKVTVTSGLINSNQDYQNPRELTGTTRVDAKVCSSDCDSFNDIDPIDVFSIKAFQNETVQFRFASRENDVFSENSVYVYVMDDYSISTYTSMTYYKMNDVGYYDRTGDRNTIDYIMPKSGKLYVWFVDQKIPSEKDVDSYTIRLNSIDTSTRDLTADRDGDGMSDVEEDRCGSSFYDLGDTALDFDGDGLCDEFDDDDDGDGISDSEDQCLKSPMGELDHDQDGCVDSEDSDDDNDGFPDESDLCPTGLFEGEDFDQDGCFDAEDSDDDNDAWTDIEENACGSSAKDSNDIPNNHDQVFETSTWTCDLLDLDDDEDGVSDTADLCPFSSYWTNTGGSGPNIIDIDTDGDGCFDNVDDDTDDDNDGILDYSDACPIGLGFGADLDGDGCKDAEDDDIDGDSFTNSHEADCNSDPLDAGDTPTNYDSDELCDVLDDDDDNDGTPDIHDSEPFNSAENTDTDQDGVGNNADLDDDGDGTPDNEDDLPLNPQETRDTDGDSIGDNEDEDIDGDGWLNSKEESCDTDLMNSNSVPADTDADTICNLLDDNDDNDAFLDSEEIDCKSNPTDANDIPLDLDSDGTCDELDSDRDGDGIPDSRDECDNSSPELSGSPDFDADGCFDVEDPDGDNDGFSDKLDNCDYNPSKINEGCPESSTFEKYKGGIIGGGIFVLLILLITMYFGLKMVKTGAESGKVFAETGVSSKTTTVDNRVDNSRLSQMSLSVKDSFNKQSSFQNILDKSKGDTTITAKDSNVNTGEGDQSNKQ
jgi:hypothetical protein